MRGVFFLSAPAFAFYAPEYIFQPQHAAFKWVYESLPYLHKTES